ncbi:hypothetical protein [Paraliomyxa miuraensis]|uniref:hypothetical protein n=1 Tax=Paraliomyxa miuraensis TaxID=376150 RepID=UPI002250E72F|nr:hypothetical protein [Paraliomyxa miuraensis]MCX4246550.1 hypothetical protein [Paraliomyxa miuraensis]
MLRFRLALRRRPRIGPPRGVALIALVARIALTLGVGVGVGGGCTPTERAPEASGEVDPGSATDPEPGSSDEPVRIKGLAPHLLLHRQRGGAVEQLSDGAMARAGDLIQISYVAAGNRNGVVVSLDGAGLVTLHHPTRADVPSILVSRGQHALDHAYELDDARSYERFVFVTSGDEPLAAITVMNAAASLAKRGTAARDSPLPLPERWRQSSILLHKEP